MILLLLEGLLTEHALWQISYVEVVPKFDLYCGPHGAKFICSMLPELMLTEGSYAKVKAVSCPTISEVVVIEQFHLHCHK